MVLPEEGPSLDRNVVVNKLCFSYTVAFNYQAGYTLLCTVVYKFYLMVTLRFGFRIVVCKKC